MKRFTPYASVTPSMLEHKDGMFVRYEDAQQQFRVLASAMRKMLPPALLAEVIDHLDPLTPFVEFLRSEAS